MGLLKDSDKGYVLELLCHPPEILQFQTRRKSYDFRYGQGSGKILWRHQEIGMPWSVQLSGLFGLFLIVSTYACLPCQHGGVPNAQCTQCINCEGAWEGKTLQY